ncbi:conserved hypothetical protein [Clostridioides difficile T61]|nr:conserved hypothetical protein [Clostridioides difficile E16]CCL95823.1 conserved hypothetical protein [Clostridioides difficile T61]
MPLFTYHIVDIKPRGSQRSYKMFSNFTYHIVDIKLKTRY